MHRLIITVDRYFKIFNNTAYCAERLSHMILCRYRVHKHVTIERQMLLFAKIKYANPVVIVRTTTYHMVRVSQ